MSAPEEDETGARPSGRVRHDAGGRAVWEWAVDSGRHAIESTSRLLKRLDLSGIGLLDEEQEKKKQEEAARQAARETGGNPYGEADPLAGGRRSFNPYDKGAPPKRGSSRPPSRPVPRITQPVRPVKKPGFLARLLGRDR